MAKSKQIAATLTPILIIASLLLSFFGASWSVAAEDKLFERERTANELVRTVLADTAVRLRQSKSLRGRFVLKKYMREIPKPLNANGDFVFTKELGIYWHTVAPFDSVFLLTPRGALQRDEGSQTFRSDARQQPGVRAALEIFAALFALDVDALSRDFVLYGSGNAGAWRVGLRPKSSGMRAVFAEAIVTGGKQIDHIELKDAGGDRTEIDVLDSEASSTPPDQKIRDLFAE